MKPNDTTYEYRMAALHYAMDHPEELAAFEEEFDNSPDEVWLRKHTTEKMRWDAQDLAETDSAFAGFSIRKVIETVLLHFGEAKGGVQ